MRKENAMAAIKSSRHSKITGDFGEYLTLYWLSRRGFECVHVDHTGIDLIAVDPKTNEQMGISVKSRSRYSGKETDSINLYNDEKMQLVRDACNVFKLIPYFAIVADMNDDLVVFLLPVAKLQTLCGGKKMRTWKMDAKHMNQYRNDREIQMVEYKRTAAHPAW